VVDLPIRSHISPPPCSACAVARPRPRSTQLADRVRVRPLLHRAVGSHPSMPHPLAPAPSGRAPPAGAQMRPGQTRPGPPRPGLGRLPAASPPVGGGPGRAAALGGVSASPSHSGRAPQATTLSRRPPLLRSSASPVSAVGAPLPAPRRPVNAGFTIPGRGLARRVTTRASAASPAPADPLARASAWLADARAWFKASPFSSRKFFPMILL